METTTKVLLGFVAVLVVLIVMILQYVIFQFIPDTQPTQSFRPKFKEEVLIKDKTMDPDTVYTYNYIEYRVHAFRWYDHCYLVTITDDETIGFKEIECEE